MLTEGFGKRRSSSEAAVDRGDREGQDAATLLPEIVAGEGQPGLRVTILDHEVGSADDQPPIQRLDELDITKLDVVLPECPHHETGLVFLDGQLALAVFVPGVPGAGQGLIRVVLVQQEALFRDHAVAEVEEALGQARIAGEVEAVGDERTVAGPHIGVGIPTELRDVVVCRSENSAPLIDLRAKHQQAALEEVYEVIGEIVIVELLLVDPEAPVVGSAREVRLRPT